MKNKYLKVAKISEAKFRTIVDCFSQDIPASTTARLARINRNTSQRIYCLLRRRITQLAKSEDEPFTGEVEVDESYFGAKRIRGKGGRGASGKTPVVGLLKRDGKVFVKIVENCSRKELLPIIKGQVLGDSTIYTDGWRAYDCLVTEGYKHYRIHHHNNEFARGKNHVNGIESFWSFVKLRLSKLRGARKDKFLTHLLESAWRFNHRKDNIYMLLLKECRSKPL